MSGITEVQQINTVTQDSKTEGRTYSKDGHFWVGMTKADALKAGGKVSDLFDYLENEKKDGVLSEIEIKIYDGPNVMNGFTFFYPGLEIESLTKPKDIEAFTRIDKLSEPGVLTEEEILQERRHNTKSLWCTLGISAAVGMLLALPLARLYRLEGLKAWKAVFASSIIGGGLGLNAGLFIDGANKNKTLNTSGYPEAMKID